MRKKNSPPDGVRRSYPLTPEEIRLFLQESACHPLLLFSQTVLTLPGLRDHHASRPQHRPWEISRYFIKTEHWITVSEPTLHTQWWAPGGPIITCYPQHWADFQNYLINSRMQSLHMISFLSQRNKHQKEFIVLLKNWASSFRFKITIFQPNSSISPPLSWLILRETMLWRKQIWSWS